MGVDAGADRFARRRALEGFGLDAQRRPAAATDEIDPTPPRY